jgi:flavorubredoxin
VTASETRILIVFASQSGGTASMAAAVERGALREDNVTVRKLHGTQAGVEDLRWCHALVIATPENFGYMAGAIKDFFDRTFYPLEGKVDNLPFALVVRAGNDGTFARDAVLRIARGYRFREVAPPILAVGALNESELLACEELGQTIAAGLVLGVFGRARQD